MNNEILVVDVNEGTINEDIEELRVQLAALGFQGYDCRAAFVAGGKLVAIVSREAVPVSS